MARGYARWVRKQEGWEEPKVKFYPLPSFVHRYSQNMGEGILRECLSENEIAPGKLRWIFHAFYWTASEEGHEFWEGVVDERGDQELACEILRSWKDQLCP